MRLITFASIPLFALAIACGDSEQATTQNANGGSGGMGGSGGAGGMSTNAGGSTGGCSPQAGVEPGPDWVCITEVNGRIIDEQDNPVETVLMTACGPGGCEPADSDAMGNFSIDVGFKLFVDDWSVTPHARDVGKITYYIPLGEDEMGPVIDLGTIRLLDKPTDGVSMTVKTDNMGAPAQNHIHAGVTLDVPDGVRVNLGFEDVALGEEGKKFTARTVPTALLPEFIDPSLGVVNMFALTPFDVRFDLESDPGTAAKVRMTFPNTTAIAADSPVEFLQLGSFIVGELEAGDYLVVATGTVSSDGMTIEMDAGEGLTFLTWVGIRETPAQ